MSFLTSEEEMNIESVGSQGNVVVLVQSLKVSNSFARHYPWLAEAMQMQKDNAVTQYCSQKGKEVDELTQIEIKEIIALPLPPLTDVQIKLLNRRDELKV